MINVMNTAKKKAGAAILCGALALTLGSGTTTFAAEGATDSLLVKHENGVINYSTDGGQTWNENAPANMQAIKIGEGNMKINNKFAPEDGIKMKVMVKEENGKKLYSTDDGQTWSETAPEGMPAFDMGEQGNIKFKMKGDLEDAIKTKVMVKEENGKKLYSTDDGQTWSETAPEGMPAFDMGEQGNIKFKMKGDLEDAIKTKVMVKEENGKKLYSTDDGQTWSETAPEGMPAFNMGEKGNIKFKMKGDLEDAIKSKVMVKVENGKKLFSTDDGQTWSEQAPEGMTVIK